MLARSYQTWLSYTAETNPQDGFQPDCILLRNILSRVPAFLANGFSKDCKSPQFKLRHSESTNNNSTLYINGWSTWNISEGNCSLKEKIMHHQLLLGLQRSTQCYFTEDSPFSNWPGVQGEQKSPAQGNCLAILSFAWAYILSALWVEMQQSKGTRPAPTQRDDRIYYLCSQAKWTCDGDEDLAGDLEVDLGDIDDDAARWWTALLANGEGWRATITRDSKVYRSPWSISLAAAQSFKLRRTAHYQNSYSEIDIPPSSDQALQFLSDFCILHNTRSQSSVALAATLTFPFLNNMTAMLPLPKLNSCPIPSKTMSLALLPTSIYPSTPPFSPSRLETEIVFEEGKLLPYYMTLSCDSRGMQSLLCGSFFDPEVSCNLVSPWLEPIFSIIDPIIQRGDYGALAIVMGKRQPKLASLWLGAIISGMAQVTLPYVRNGSLSVELHASAWTSTIHSFINARPSIQCTIDNNGISRSDECRLLYLTESEGHSRVPVCPWKPFGTTLLCDTEIEVRQHAKCSGHYLQYLSWSWELTDGTSSIDRGFSTEIEFTEIFTNSGDIVSEVWKDRELKSELLSELATRSIFGWLRVTGYPRCEQDIYRHSWIDPDLEESDEEELDDGISAGKDGLRDAADIHNWIDSTFV
ncbi:hypothetical protein OCU04_001084 [Sclerotinia nivalis]|uniref:Uncharacterized protein n=1 Tax=Sclerotinia nivalis TaxID=352851 RepID=A0A9X0DRP6_9HELO|nr:hypothetical protein OCU04_001084 [Sclerotinia nivalis]